MAKTYKGSLSLEWYNKQMSILLKETDSVKSEKEIPAPKINWINKDEALFYEIVDDEGRGLEPYWVPRNDIRVKESRPLIFQKAFIAEEKNKKGSLPGLEKEYVVKESKIDDPKIENILIKGDNLLALNTLKKIFDQKPDEEKIKCIYIDPPYNTGSAFKHYNDNLEHSEWLTLMRDRLIILREILRHDGLIWINLDDEENHYLKILCDEIFGRNNFLANVIWEKADSPRMDAKFFSSRHDHILVYVKDIEKLIINQVPNVEGEELSHYNKIDTNGKKYYLKPLRAMGKDGTREARPSLYFYIIAPDGSKIFPKNPDRSDSRWRWGPERMKAEKNRIEWIKGRNGWNPYYRVYEELNSTKPPETIWLHSEVGSNRTSKAEIKAIFKNNKLFDTPKPEKLIKRIFEISSQENDLILDCFAGSGTTIAVAHKMGRRWIGVEIGNHTNTHIIPRLKKVISGEDQSGISKTLNWNGGDSFKYYHLGKSIIDYTKKDFNWTLGKKFIEESFIASYDYIIDKSIKLKTSLFHNEEESPVIGFQTIGNKTIAGIITLHAPDEKNEIIIKEEIDDIYQTIKKAKSPHLITIFTNRGVEIPYDFKPDDLEIIKIPQAIFSELEK